MEIKLRSAGKMRGDCTAPYVVEMSEKCTVKEFVEYVLEECQKEWGYIGIFSKGHFFGNPKIEYSHGKLTTENTLKEVENKVVRRAVANGGWSNMDYILHIEDEKGEEMINDKLELLSMADRFDVKKSGGRFDIFHKEEELMATIDDKGITYYVTGAYNCGTDYLDINMEALMELKEFCEMMIKE